MPLPPEIWEALIKTPSETREVEYKQSCSWSDIEHKLAKTVLAMANMPNPGYVVIGVAEQGGKWVRDGMNSAHIQTYNLQTMGQALASYGTPAPDVDVMIEEYEGDAYLVVAIKPFQESPILCCKSLKPDGGGVREGIAYYRTVDKTSRPAGRIEWQELMSRFGNMAADRFVRRLQNLDMLRDRIPASSDAARFDGEARDFL
jgi:predicted HTH transcriptional regulator